MDKKTATLVILALVGTLAIGAYGGYLYGTRVGGADMKKLVDMVYPEPPAELHSLEGTVTDLGANLLKLEVRDPNDYLPHPDGTDSVMQTRGAFVTSATKITLADSSRLDANGDPAVIPLKPLDLKVGMRVIITSNENIKNAYSFDANEVRILK